MRAAVDEAARRIDAGAMAGQPDVEVAVRNAIGTTYEGLGLYEPAERQLRTALDLQSRSARSPSMLADTNTRLVNVLYKAQKFAEAVPVAREAVRLRKEALGPQASGYGHQPRRSRRRPVVDRRCAGAEAADA